MHSGPSVETGNQQEGLLESITERQERMMAAARAPGNAFMMRSISLSKHVFPMAQGSGGGGSQHPAEQEQVRSR